MVERLSGREMMVLQQLARGKTNKEIADGMFLSNKTVSTYKTRLPAQAQCPLTGRSDRVGSTQWPGLEEGATPWLDSQANRHKKLREGGFRPFSADQRSKS